MKAYSAFLEGMKRYGSDRPITKGKRSAINLLLELRYSEKPLEDLVKNSGLPFIEIAEVVEMLQKNGLIVLTGEPGREMARATNLGLQIIEFTANEWTSSN